MVSTCFFHPRESVWYLHAFCPHPKESRHPLWYLHAFVLIQGSQSGVCMLLSSSKGVSLVSAQCMLLSSSKGFSLLSACFCTHPRESVSCLHAFCSYPRESRHPVWCLHAFVLIQWSQSAVCMLFVLVQGSLDIQSGVCVPQLLVQESQDMYIYVLFLIQGSLDCQSSVYICLSSSERVQTQP